MAIVGLEKLYYALVTKDDETGLTYGTPVYLAGVKELKVSPKMSTEKLYAENKLWDQDTALDEIEVTINLADLTSAQRSALLGHSAATEGGVYASSTDTLPYLALLYKANKTNGQARYQVLYKGRFELPDDSAKGKEGKTDFQTPEMKGTFQPTQYNSMWKYQVDTNDANCPANIDTTFFNAVIIPGSDTAIPTVTTSPADGATSVSSTANVTFTFSKALNADTVNASNVFLMKADGTAVATALSLDATSKIITLDPSASLDAGSYIAICTTGVKTIAGISAAVNTVVNFTV